MDDIYSEKIYLDEFDVTVETSYRLNFDAEKTCGFSRVFKGRVDGTPDEETYEIYMELYECGLTREKIEQNLEKLVKDIKAGKVDVTF